MADVVMNLIDPLETRYRWDKTDEQIAIAKRDMVDAFKHHAIEDLKSALRYIVLHRKFSTMPTVGDVTDVLDRVVSERKASQVKATAKAGQSFSSAEAFLDNLAREREDGKAWARDWLRRSPLGQQSLEEGWCRALHEIIWQIRLNRTRAGKSCELDGIQIRDIATQSKRGEELIEYFQAYCRARNPKFERVLVLKEEWA